MSATDSAVAPDPAGKERFVEIAEKRWREARERLLGMLRSELGGETGGSAAGAAGLRAGQGTDAGHSPGAAHADPAAGRSSSPMSRRPLKSDSGPDHSRWRQGPESKPAERQLAFLPFDGLTMPSYAAPTATPVRRPRTSERKPSRSSQREEPDEPGERVSASQAFGQGNRPTLPVERASGVGARPRMSTSELLAGAARTAHAPTQEAARARRQPSFSGTSKPRHPLAAPVIPGRVPSKARRKNAPGKPRKGLEALPGGRGRTDFDLSLGPAHDRENETLRRKAGKAEMRRVGSGTGTRRVDSATKRSGSSRRGGTASAGRLRPGTRPKEPQVPRSGLSPNSRVMDARGLSVPVLRPKPGRGSQPGAGASMGLFVPSMRQSRVPPTSPIRQSGVGPSDSVATDISDVMSSPGLGTTSGSVATDLLLGED